jgi:endoglucanase
MGSWRALDTGTPAAQDVLDLLRTARQATPGRTNLWRLCIFMRMRLTLLYGVLVVNGSLWSIGSAYPADKDKDARADNRLLGRGINLGNALDAPKEGEWGLTLEAKHFQVIKQAGFASVRIPIRWSAHASAQPPYTIDPAFFKRIDWAIDQARSQQLTAVINVHHYDGMDREPDKHLPRLLALWRQIAQRYRDQPEGLFFEILNEPHDQLTDERWQRMIPPLLAVIRASNPQRIVIVGPGHWNSLQHLSKLQLPEQDRRLIVTFHYYSPFPFTHQGAPWAKGSDKWKGTTWTGTPKELDALRKDFEQAAAWGKQHGRPLYLGEFGAFSAAPMESRACWTRAVAREAERHSMSWAYWEFAAGFGAYDPAAGAWRQPLLHALLDQPGGKTK